MGTETQLVKVEHLYKEFDENTKVYYNTPLINQESTGEAGDMQDGITFDMGGGMQGGGGAPGGGGTPGGGRPSGGGPDGF